MVLLHNFLILRMTVDRLFIVFSETIVFLLCEWSIHVVHLFFTELSALYY